MPSSSVRRKLGIVKLTIKRGIWHNNLAQDTALTAAILDRLLHHSTILNIKGDSFRLRDKKKTGIVPIEMINKQ